MVMKLCFLSDEKEKDVDTAEDGVQHKSNGSQAPRALHKTCSIFLRNLAPSITKQEVVAVSVFFVSPGKVFLKKNWGGE